MTLVSCQLLPACCPDRLVIGDIRPIDGDLRLIGQNVACLMRIKGRFVYSVSVEIPCDNLETIALNFEDLICHVELTVSVAIDQDLVPPDHSDLIGSISVEIPHKRLIACLAESNHAIFGAIDLSVAIGIENP